jgi:hypothetical protein
VVLFGVISIVPSGWETILCTGKQRAMCSLASSEYEKEVHAAFTDSLTGLFNHNFAGYVLFRSNHCLYSHILAITLTAR